MARLQSGPRIWAVVTLSMTILGQAFAAGCPNLLEQGFTARKGRDKYSRAMVQRDFPNTKRPYKMIVGGDQGSPLTVVQDRVIKGSFPKGAISGKETGFTWYSVLPKENEEVSMSYKVKFSAGFEWTKGGKLPGLCGGGRQQVYLRTGPAVWLLLGRDGRSVATVPETYESHAVAEGKAACPVGCSAVSRDRAFSTRLMWREGGRMVAYAYYPDKPKSIRCGEDWLWSKKVQTDKWHHIRMWMKLNTPGKKDGEFKAWLDGAQVLHRTRIPFRYKSEFKISRAYITTYCGGSSRAVFAPKQDQQIWFDEFKVWKGSCSQPDGSPSTPALIKPPSVAPPNPQPAPKSPAEGAGHGNNYGAANLARDYKLYKSEAGWEIPSHGDLGKVLPGSGLSMKQEIEECAKFCDRKRGCTIFTYYQGACYLKRDVGKDPSYKGKTSKGWRWLYIEED